MAGKSAALTVNVVADASKAVKAFSATGDAGKAMAAQLNQAADKMERDLENTKKIADKLAQALGPGFKSKVGDTIDDIAAQFNRAGLQIEDVENNLPDLVRGLKRVENQADDTADQMTRIGTETDRSRGAMNGFVGNAVSEIPGLSEVFGPLGESIGQMAEGVAAGEMNMKSLITTGLGMGAVGAVFAGVNMFLGEMAKKEAETKRQAEGRLQVYEALSDSKYQEAAQALYDTYKLQFEQFGQKGIDKSTMTRILLGDKKAIEESLPKLKAYASAAYDAAFPGVTSDVQRRNFTAMYFRGYVEELEGLAGAYTSTTTAANSERAAVEAIGLALSPTTTKTEQLATANTEAATAVWSLYEAQLGLIDLQLGQRGAERNYRRALEEYNKVNADGNATEDQKAEALDNVEMAALGLSGTVGDLAAAEGGAAAGAQAQIDNLKGLAAYMAPGSELRNNIEGYIGQLQRAAQIEIILGQIQAVKSSGSWQAADMYQALLRQLGSLGYTGAVPGFANGTMNAPRGVALVGENGPELIDFGGGERVYSNQRTNAMLDGGGASITVNMPAGADGDDVVRALQKWVRRNGQLPLPVSSKTVR